MRCVILVEGPTDAEILRCILHAERDRMEIKVADGKSHAETLARSILAFRPQPVLLLLDAETTNEQQVKEQKALYSESLGMGSSRDRFKVCMAVPMLEAILFEDPAALEAATRHQLSEVDKVRARFEPQKVLREISGGESLHKVLARLTKGALTILRKQPLIAEIREFIDRPGAVAQAC